MIGMRTILQVADNSGARKLSCILPLGGDVGLQAGLGDIITAAVKEAAPDSAIPKGKVVKCVIVRMRKEQRRRDGSYIRFDENAAVLINDANEPVGTRVFGPVARELREKKFLKIVSLAPEVCKGIFNGYSKERHRASDFGAKPRACGPADTGKGPGSRTRETADLRRAREHGKAPRAAQSRQTDSRRNPGEGRPHPRFQCGAGVQRLRAHTDPASRNGGRQESAHLRQVRKISG